MSFGKALYFPYIHFQNEDWLKYTLLYWDGVKRIVPRSYYPEDSEAVKILVDARSDRECRSPIRRNALYRRHSQGVHSDA